MTASITSTLDTDTKAVAVFGFEAVVALVVAVAVAVAHTDVRINIDAMQQNTPSAFLLPLILPFRVLNFNSVSIILLHLSFFLLFVKNKSYRNYNSYYNYE